MNIWEQDKLFLFIAFIIPGFVSIKAYELFFPSEPKDSSKQLVDALTYSCVNYAVLFWAIVYVEQSGLRDTVKFAYFIFYIIVFFVSPIVLVWIWKKIRMSDRFQHSVPHPTQKPWDYVFGKRTPYWVMVTLKDGTKIAGEYGYNSFSSSAPSQEQLYLEQAWKVNEDGGFERPRESTAGIIILSNEITTVELFSKT